MPPGDQGSNPLPDMQPERLSSPFGARLASMAASRTANRLPADPLSDPLFSSLLKALAWPFMLL
ncbi:hypothetical protein J2W49_001124 [Hydrogenophaga palleronii]|uniref:Uncharacterized protein n=1 Tax=Hydrogenophaga palleronii TaxID=65655 RepID=A0ABU1WIS4_9BURK|nr:hypothetical protein [Hydrogenophaga palleronii]